MHAIIEFACCLLLLTLLAVPLGAFIARLVSDHRTPFAPERWLYRVAGVNPTEDMTWRQYTLAVLIFNFFGFLLVYVLLRLQGFLPLNPRSFAGVEPGIAANTAVSFVSNTNWQAYGGETTMSHFSQMVALTSQNFVSAATGGAALLAVIRGLTRSSAKGIGNFWVDVTRLTLVLLPLSAILAVALLYTGVPQTLDGVAQQSNVETRAMAQVATGPVASQVAIKQLGTNGGGFYNVNSAHPLENPSPASNTLEWLAILLVPAALCFTFGNLVSDRRQGWVLYTVMTLILVGATAVTLHFEFQGTPLAGSASAMEGKETRFGVASSALWAVATTAASNGSVNAMHDSLTPLGGLGPMVLMQLGEVVFGGVGSGLYGMLLFVVVAVFISGLMVGRTPEYLGKKIEAKEMKMASLGILIPSAFSLVLTAVASVSTSGVAALGNPGPHGFSEILYAFSSASNNNGSAFGGLDASKPFYLALTTLGMLAGRYWVMIPALAIAGSLAAKRRVPVTAGTLPTHTPLFVFLLVGVVLLLGALTFVPALALGPVIEQLHMVAR